MKLQYILLILSFCSTTILTNAQQITGITGAVIPDSMSIAITSYGEKYVSENGHYGLSIGLIRNGKKYSYHFGRNEIGRQSKPTDRTMYEIASVTKSFTGILLAQAIVEKRINLEDNIQQYLQKSFPNLIYQGKAIKIKHLAAHLSGLPKFVPAFDQGLSPHELMKRYNGFSEIQFLDALSAVELDTMPGKKFIYSNADAQLTGIILENVYHSSFAQLLRKYITGPHKMKDTRLKMKNRAEVRGYNYKGEMMPQLDWWKMIPAAGYIKSDIRDMLKYLQWNIDESNPVIRLAHRPVFKISEEGADSIGLFWFIRKSLKNERIVYHAGGSFGNTSYCEIRPDQQSGIVLLTNDASPGTEEELKRLADLIMNRYVNSE